MKLLVRKRNLELYIYLLMTILITGILIFFSNNIYLDLFGFVLLVFIAMSLVGFDLAHPYVWFSFIFMLYSISYPLLYIFGETYDINSYTKSLLFSQWLALVVFLLVVTPSKVNFNKLKKKNLQSNKIFNKPIFAFLLIMIFILYQSDFKHKSEIYDSGSILFYLGFRLVLVLLVIYTINMVIFALKYKRIDKKLFFSSMIFIFAIVLLSGERDLILRFLVITIFIYYILILNSKITKEIIIIGIGSLISIPLLSRFKYFGLTGELSKVNSSLLIRFLKSDFQSASKNMQILLLDKTTKGLFKGFTILSSFFRALDLDKLLKLDVISAGGWYNDRFFSINRAGQGFTLVGEGYINFGYIGIVILFAFVAYLVRFIYKNSNRGVYWFAFYIISIPIFMYAIRADLSNILSPLLKHNILILLLLKLLTIVIYKIQGTRN